MKKSSNVRFVMVSVDPERDTRERMGQYVEAFDKEFIGLTGTLEELAAVWSAYNVRPEKEEVAGSALGYAVSHPAFTYVIDKSGNLRLVHFLGIRPTRCRRLDQTLARAGVILYNSK